MTHLAIVHGPNLDRLGSREPQWYGHLTLNQLTRQLDQEANELGITLMHAQFNQEAMLVEHLYRVQREIDGLIVNAAAWTHTSVAVRDALMAIERPFIEVHVSNPFAREHFRHRSLLADQAIGIICGFGLDSYVLALRAFKRRDDRHDHSD